VREFGCVRKRIFLEFFNLVGLRGALVFCLGFSFYLKET
jgi:hypothetical protein